MSRSSVVPRRPLLPRRPIEPRRPLLPRRPILVGLLITALAVVGALASACSGPKEGETVQFTVPPGATFVQVMDTLWARDLIRNRIGFRALARFRGDDRNLRAGQYSVPEGIGMGPLLDILVEGRMVTIPMTIPEGFTLRQMAPRIAQVTEMDPDDVLAELQRLAEEDRWNVPGPGLEGYLFPDTYLFAPGLSLDSVVESMVRRYQRIWTPERRERAEEMGMTEQEVMTLASIVQGEARRVEEMPRIAGVFHHRLRIGYLLQADPTIQFALGERRSRLLYADIDAVADHPYNTYTQPGLPPGPIGAAGEAAVEATLFPEDTRYLYFVARPDGTHIFTRTLQEHNRARVQARREWNALQTP
ncbi:MAG: endolytic transglycosylase MltG [Gemmatimonadales bacterium]|nr:MAG: endolytic transglycosylase MltG [Gemmatimonadales bacterium]